MRKRRALICGAVMAAALAAGVGGAAGKATSKHDTVTLTMEYVNTVQNAWSILIANFERVYPNIHIEPQYLDSTGQTTLLPAMIQAGNAPDLLYATAGGTATTAVWPLAKAGILKDMSGRPWAKRIVPSALYGVTYNNKVYALPLAFGPNGLFYNTDLFKQLGLTVPTTFSELLTMCKTITAKGKIPIALGLAGSTIGINLMVLHLDNQFVYSKDPDWDNKRNANKVTFASSPLWRAEFQQIVNMYKAGCFEPDPTGVTYPAGAGNLVASGQAVMEFLSGGTIPSVTSINPNIKYAMFEVPPDNTKKNTVASLSLTLTISINAATQHPVEAQQFIDFLARVKQNSLWAKVANSIAPFDAKKGIFPDFLAASAQPLADAGRVLINPQYDWSNPAFTPAFYSNIIGLMTGQETITSALENLDKAWFAPASP